jgi:hypothetical protein
MLKRDGLFRTNDSIGIAHRGAWRGPFSAWHPPRDGCSANKGSPSERLQIPCKMFDDKALALKS